MKNFFSRLLHTIIVFLSITPYIASTTILTKPDISFVIADIKYNKGTLKILEMGEGPRSYFKGHEQLYGEGKIWQSLWEYLKTFKLPIWYVGEELTTPHKQKQIAHDDLYNMGGQCFSSINHLKKNSVFKERMNKKITNFGNNVSDYQGIIIVRRYKNRRTEVETFKREYPNFIYLDDAVCNHVNNKHKTSLAFNRAGLDHYRPRWNVYSKLYTSELSDKIAADLTTDTFVIKPVNSANGWGIIMTHRTELDQTLNLILNHKELCAQSKDRSFNQWAQDRNNTFLIEEYVASQPLKIDTKLFDPTLRMIFVLHYDQQKIGMHFLGSYWKLPELALDEKGSFTKKHKSKIIPYKQSSEKVSLEDEKEVQTILRSIMPILYEHMLKD